MSGCQWGANPNRRRDDVPGPPCDREPLPGFTACAGHLHLTTRAFRTVPAGGALSPEGSARSDGQRGWARSLPSA